MKIIKEFRFALLLLVYAMIIVLFTSYGNKKVHPDINDMIVKKFLDLSKKGDFDVSEFYKYTFIFNEGKPLRGRAITKDGLFSEQDVTAAGIGFGTNLSAEGPAQMNAHQWIKHGGYAADVPEVPASLRHFYDPTRDKGDRYLTDITNAKIMGSLQKYVFTNPRIDGVEWALGKPGDISEAVQDHKYTWEHGKIWMQMALRESKQDKREEYMASAWRALGETLHMIADNGCPSHVRNDAHPSPLWNNNSWFGNPDPYEEFVDIIRRDNSSEFALLAGGKPNDALAVSFRNAKTAYEIADALAVFTNMNFVTNETISGTDRNGKNWKQTIHPDYAYTAPLLQNMTYNDAGYTYSSSLGVMQCSDHYYFAKLIPKICDPFVNIACVKSQAGVLIPNIIEAGANAIKLFIPKLSVEITSIDKGILKGKVEHKTDEEYPTEIKYVGEVVLTIKDKNGKEVDKISVEAKNGTFEKNNINLAKDNKILASIEFGNITIESPEFFEAGDILYGVYQGTYSIKVNEKNWIQAEIEKMNPDGSEESIRYVANRGRDIAQLRIKKINWIKDGAQGGPIAKFQIGGIKEMGYYYETKGIAYSVNNASSTAFIPKILTPLKDKSNAGTSLQCKSNGFTSTVVNKEGTYTINGTFKGNELVGDWTLIYNGKVLFTAKYSAKRVSAM